jgi:sulfoxide reductase heme-binding subunit YedZ
MRLSSRAWVVLGAALGLALVFVTDQIVPAATPYQAQMRIWLAARASGIASYLLLTALVVFGMLLSHPTNQATWKQSKRVFPWHEHLFVFVIAFVLVHVVAIIADPFAGVGIGGALVPGLSSYRSAPVALGSLALYAAIATAVTARWTRLLPAGLWLRLHRLAALAWLLAWLHGVLAGTDSMALQPMYLASGVVVIGFAAWRYWIPRRGRGRQPLVAPGQNPAAIAALQTISARGSEVAD